MKLQTNSNEFADLGRELSPEQLESVTGGSPLLGPRAIVHLIGEAGKLVGGVASDVGHALGHAASNVGHAVADAGQKVISFLGSLF
jgi:hypothetical protein